MRLINANTFQLETFDVEEETPPYAILSHTWGAPEEEVSFTDTLSGNITGPRYGVRKLMGCCNQARSDGLNYVWVDTCCINKTDSVEFGEAINSMFRWYKRAFVCYAYLADVFPEAEGGQHRMSTFAASRWFRRGWTLQELLAPKNVKFYNPEWQLIGDKEWLAGDIQKVTGIPPRFLLGWRDISKASAAQRLSWAANRETTKKEDLAYCLLGLFDINMIMNYGEGDKAFERLQQEILVKTGDCSILAWGLGAPKVGTTQTSSILSAGVLATALSDFAGCGDLILSDYHESPTVTFNNASGRLRIHAPLYEDRAGGIYVLLNCCPSNSTQEFLGVPLRKTSSVASPNSYLRPQGHHPKLIPDLNQNHVSEAVDIQIKRESMIQNTSSVQYWIYVDGYKKMKLTWIDEYPRAKWADGRFLIKESLDHEQSAKLQEFVRFRTQDDTFADIIVVLEFQTQLSEPHPRCYLLSLPKTTSLQELAHNFKYLSHKTLGNGSINNGYTSLKATVTTDKFANQQTFAVELGRAPSPPRISIDVGLELQSVKLKLGFLSLLLEDTQSSQELDDVDMKLPSYLQERLERVERKLCELTEHVVKRGSQNWLEKLIQLRIETEQLGYISEGDQAGVARAKSSGHLAGSEKPGKPHTRDTIRDTPLIYAVRHGYESMAKLLLERGAKVEAWDGHGNTALLCAIHKQDERLIKVLLRKGADIEARDQHRYTPLLYAARRGHWSTVRLLLGHARNLDLEARDINGNTALMMAARNGDEFMISHLHGAGAKIEAQNCRTKITPLGWAALMGHEGATVMLIRRGANIEAKTVHGCTPLMLAARNGREAVVKVLLEQSADREAKDESGETALSMVYERYPDMATRFEITGEFVFVEVPLDGEESQSGSSWK